MNYCILCLNASKSSATNINDTVKGREDLLVGDLIRIHFTFGERILTETRSEKVCYRCFTQIDNFHSFHESVANNYGLDEHLKEKKELSSMIVYENDVEKPSVEILDEHLIKIETAEDEIEEVTAPVEENWIDEYSQSELMSPMPEPSVSKTRKKRSKREKYDLDSSHDSTDDQRIRETVNMNCDYCFDDLDNFRDAKIHYKDYHGVEGYFKCCGRKFKQKCRLVDHVNGHYDLAYSCTFCEKGFNSKSYLMKHMACHEIDKQFKCDHCPKVFAKKFQVRNHLMSVHVFDNVEPQFECPMENCGKKFVNQARLKHHVDYTHASEDAVICDICSKTFKTKHAVEEHRQIHFKRPEDRIKCEICGHYLSNMKTYKRHRKNHDTESMENTCNFCGKISPNQNALKKHIQYVHVRAATFQCRYCEKSFKRSRNLIDHEASVHTLQELYTCSFCPKTFRNQSNMLCHRKKMHPDLYKKPAYMRDEV